MENEKLLVQLFSSYPTANGVKYDLKSIYDRLKEESKKHEIIVSCNPAQPKQADLLIYDVKLSDKAITCKILKPRESLPETSKFTFEYSHDFKSISIVDKDLL
jgi:hypothetical protein